MIDLKKLRDETAVANQWSDLMLLVSGEIAKIHLVNGLTHAEWQLERDRRIVLAILDYIISGAAPMTEWIPVGERLPTQSEVLITFKHRRGRPGPLYVKYAFFGKLSTGKRRWFLHINGKEHVFDIGKGPVEIIAWMPLPKPYQPPEL